MKDILKQGWQSFDVRGCLEDTILKGVLKNHSYNIEENGELKLVCIISEHSNPNLTKGIVFPETHSGDDQAYRTVIDNQIRDKDIDLLKLKCLIKAKQNGWNIKKLN